MNKNLHRVIWSAARAARVVVHEAATSTGKSTSKATKVLDGTAPDSAAASPLVATAALFGLLVAMPGHAQIVANPMAPGGMRPTILVAPNGIPAVNIATPSAAGVSRNQYLQFDVNGRGVVVNNSRTSVQSGIAGWIAGNPYLATGPARVIVNEVYSSNPSYINGPVEIAGAKADFILANPAGIAVSGGTFINAAGVVLSTGVPQYNAFGGLDSYVVRGGTVTINGAGLDLSRTDYAAILARAVQVNAAIHASDLKVVTGANTISADHATVTPTAGTGVVPAFSLDVALLGGMFANKITLVGNEAGLGVRNAGSIGASAGNLVVTASGQLINTGTLEGQSVQLASTGSDIVNQGTIRQTSMAPLSLTAPTISNANGGWIGPEPAPAPTAGDGSTGTGATPSSGSSGSTGTTTASTGGTTTGGTAAPAPAPIAPGTITAAGAIKNDGGKVYAGGPITVQTANLVNNGGTLSVASMSLNQPSFQNSGGTLNVSGAFTANLSTFSNDTGTLHAGSLDISTSGDFSNQDGVLTSDSNANLTVGGQADNTRGSISGAGALTANVAGATLNNSGTLASNQGLTLHTASLQNTAGSIQSAQAGVQLAVTNQLVNGSGGNINAATDLDVQAGSLANGGSLRGANDVNVAVDGAMTNDGSITAGRHTSITAGSLQSGAAGVLGAGIQNDGKLGAAGDLVVATSGALVANGTNLVAGNATLQGASIDLSSSQTSAANIAIAATQGNVTTNKATITTPGTLNLKAAGMASNIEGTLAGNGNTTVDAASLDNSAGTLASVAGDLRVITSGATVNTAGRMLASGPVVLANSGLANTDGAVSGDSLSIDTHGGALDNTRGTLTATTTVALNTGALVNDAGLIQSGGAMTIDTNGQALTNSNAAGHSTGQGGIASADTLALNTGAVNNAAGFIGATNALDATTRSFTNIDGGMVLGQSTVAINTQGASYDNSHGQTLAIGDLGVNAGSITNAGGLIRSTATTTLNAGSIDNRLTSGAEQGIEGQNVAIAATNVDNTAGAIRADVNTTLTSSGRIDNGAGGLIHAGDTLAIVDPNAANPGAKTLRVANGGTLLAGKALVVDAASLANTGRLLSQQDMRLALTQDAVFAAGSETIANRDLGIATTGNISNSGRIAAGNALSLAAANIDNTATGDIQGTTTHLSATGTVTNRGVIDGIVTRIDAGTLTNIGTGRIYGDQISIGVGTLNNLAETAANGATSAATIAARQRLDIGATTVNNRDGSLIFSDGDLFIGGGLDAAGHATGSASTVNNHAATIEATRNVDIKTGVLNNTNGGVTWTMQPGSSQHIVEYSLPGSSVRYAASEVLFSIGGFQRIPDIGWNGWAGVPATDPQGPGSNANMRLLIPSPDYPLDQFRAYYLRSPANSADRSYQHCSGGDVQVCETVAMPGVWYSRTDPIWATFGITPPAEDLPADFIGRLHPDITVGQEGIMVSFDTPSGQPGTRLEPFDHPVTQAEYDQWQAYRTAHKKLDEATLAFIYTMTGHTSLTNPDDYKPTRMSSIYDAYDYLVTSSTPVLQSSAPGRILAGGAMNIAVGSGVNDMSQILAGGALTVTGGTIQNVGLTVDAPTVQKGIAIHSSINEHDFGSDERVYQLAPYNLTTNSSVTLAAARQEGNVAVAGSGTGTGTLTRGQTGTGAQGAGGVSAGTRVNPIIEVPAAGPGGTAGASSSAPAVVRTTVPNATVPTASLFTTHPESSSRYLIETDPRFANHRTWLSSDYLLNNLGLDPNNALKRLGDGFYEQRLIREQVAQLTGFRYLNGFESDEAQYTALMNAGATFAKQYGLRPGIGLTDAQMAQLTSDIVWLVEQTVTLPDGSTQRVLVPQVYVHVKPGDIDGSGAVLSGRSVDMQFTGDITNDAGTIAGRNAVVLTGQNINNLGGRITGDDVSLTARNDLNVIGGIVDARSRLAVVAGRDINVVTTTRDSKSTAGALPRSDASSGVGLSAVTLDRVAGLYVTNPGGSLVAVAGRDMNLVGAEVQSGGDATLAAGRDVNIDTVTTGRSEDIRWSSRNTRKEELSQETGTTVSGAGNVSISAGRDLTGRAATLSAGQTLSLDAGDKLTLYAGENRASADTHHATKKGMSHYSLDADSQETTLARTTLAGKDIQLRSGGDMTLGAIQADAENLDIQSGGRLNLLTQSTTSAASRKENDGDAAWVSAQGSGHVDETSQYNLFNVQNLRIRADGGVTAQVGQNDSLAALGQQPGMAWVNQLANDPAFANSVEWQRVQEEHKKWAYDQTSLGPVSALVVSVVVGVATAGAGTAVMGASAAAYPATTVAIQAGITAMASQATVSMVNNGGDLGKVFQELGSSEGIKNIATAMVTAGVLQGISTVLPDNLASATNGSARFTDQLQRQLIDGAASSVIRSAINGTSLEDELRSGLTNAILNTVAAQSADGIGKLRYDGDINAFTQNVLHAIAGCAVGAVRADSSSGCGAGALGAVIGELTANAFGRDEYGNVRPGAVEMTQVLAAIGGAVAGLDAQGIYIAANSSVNAAINNALSLRGSAKLKGDLRACSEGTGKSCNVEELRTEMTGDSDRQSARIKSACDGSGSLANCTALANSANQTLNNLVEAYFYADTPEKKALVDDLLSRQVTDMTQMYEALATQQSTAGFADLLKTAITGALPIVGPGVAGMVTTKLGGKSAGVLPNEPIALSKAKFGHAFDTHGQSQTEFLKKRASGSGMPTGQFLDDQAAARLIQENLGKLANGAISVPVPDGFPARVIMPDGKYIPAKSIRIVPSGSGVKTAYPEP